MTVMDDQTKRLIDYANKIVAIQSALKAPKSNENSFGKYKYRSCEDILEAVKPLLAEQGLTLIINDEIVLIGDRYYVKATAELSDGIQSSTATAYAREEEIKKGMDAAQITGSASSYARKYALNGLFAIDDTKDPDTGDHDQRGAPAAKPDFASLKDQARKKMVQLDIKGDDATAYIQAALGKDAPETVNDLQALIKALDGEQR